MNIVDVEECELKDLGKNRKNYVFGASDTGKKLVGKLMKNGLHVEGIWDNDELKQGKLLEGIPIIPYNQLSESKHINLFIGCAYAIQEEKRILELDDAVLYQVDKLRDFKRNYEPLKSYFSEFIRKNEEQIPFYNDDYSRDTAQALIKLVTEYDTTAPLSVVTEEEHYFIRQVMDALPVDGVFVDCGAFTGELPQALRRLKIPFSHCFCFEMEEKNCHVAASNIEVLKIQDKVTIERFGVSEKNGYLFYEQDGACSKIVDYETANKIETVSLDSYFDKTHIDFIKMDIEGAELGALKGGIEVIKRDRPILSISVYHSLYDRTDIFDYLRGELKGYTYYLRHHSIWGAETVLYCIPEGDVE